jgi:hypothetical protein
LGSRACCQLMFNCSQKPLMSALVTSGNRGASRMLPLFPKEQTSSARCLSIILVSVIRRAASYLEDCRNQSS